MLKLLESEPYDEEKERAALLGLTEESSDEERKRVIFEAAAKTRCFSVTTLSPSGKAHARLLSFYLLPDGNLYFGTARGKAVYDDLANDPRVTLVGTFYEEERLRAYGIRIRATVAKATDPDMIAEYWRINPGTEKMYCKGLDLFEVMYLKSGECEMSHVYTAGHNARIHVGFGGEMPEPPRYSITDKCTQCGICADACLTGTIRLGENGYYIRRMDCLECGKCAQVCPVENAICVYSDGEYRSPRII